MTVLAFLQEPITRDGAREEAATELSRRIYQVQQDGWVQRAFDWVVDKVGNLFEDAIRVTPGGLPSLVLVVVALVLVAVAIRLGLGPAGIRDALTDRRRGSRAMTAAEYRAEADRLAGTGDYKEAVRARFRAIIRELEQRAVLDPRPGRTAGEIAREGGTAVPAIRPDLHTVATTFDLIWYGAKPAAATDYALVRDADDRIAGARLTIGSGT